MPFSRLYYHVIWATKNRASWITAEVEMVLLRAVEEKSVSLECPIYALNNWVDHIHVAVGIHPKIAVSEWVKHVKGASSYTVNESFPNLPERFSWQEGYGALTFGAKQLTWVTDYIARQKEHHQLNALEPYLERMQE